MRIDQFLGEHFNISRSRAQLLIKDGAVCVSGKTITKSSCEIPDNFDKNLITITDTIKYVSRAGLKLEHAVQTWNISISDAICLDVGSSTGGFTDFLLRNNAKKVVAVDVGTDQFHELLKSDTRVELHEGTDIRSFETDVTFDGIVCDASFISLHNIIPVLEKFSYASTWFILLIKPQFEVGKEFLNKQGIVKDIEKIQSVVQGIKESLQENKIYVQGIIDSPILGGDGNQEFLVYATKNSSL